MRVLQPAGQARTIDLPYTLEFAESVTKQLSWR
jgi:hypothetical protein